MRRTHGSVVSDPPPVRLASSCAVPDAAPLPTTLDIDVELPAFSDFDASGKAVLAFLHERFGFDLWMVTRTEGDNWIVLQSDDHGYGVAPGTVFRWADSFCCEMIKGHGPRIAPNAQTIPAYAASPIGRQVQIRSYIGMPLLNADGSVFGTLCGIHPMPQPESIVGEQALVELLATMLSTVLQMELKSADAARRAERLQTEALTDALTTLYNRRGWDRLLGYEEDRCRRYGHSAAVVVVDIDDLKRINDSCGHAAGDAIIARAALALQQAARSLDIVARLGGDEFGIIGVECDRAGGDSLLRRVQAELAAAGVEASAGLAVREPSRGLTGAWEHADELMYAHKRAR